jgi:hypothetical protein
MTVSRHSPSGSRSPSPRRLLSPRSASRSPTPTARSPRSPRKLVMGYEDACSSPSQQQQQLSSGDHVSMQVDEQSECLREACSPQQQQCRSAVDSIDSSEGELRRKLSALPLGLQQRVLSTSPHRRHRSITQVPQTHAENTETFQL